jgi:ribonucleotide monophosphatase NagD (HAD superfamily)
MAELRDKRLFLLDMDGTIYLDERLFDGVKEFLSHVRAIGGRYLFLTNNSSRGVEGYIEKMHRLGIETTADDFLTSVDATVRHLRRYLPGKRCYVFGTRSFYGQLEAAGIPVIRLGLNPTEELSGGAAAGGAYHPALGELVKSRILLEKARALLRGVEPGRSVVLAVGKGKRSQMAGQHRENLRRLTEEFSLTEIRIRERKEADAEITLLPNP